MAVAKASDLIILCVGLDKSLEGEKGDTGNQDASGDKPDLYLPPVQQRLCEEILALGKRVILVLSCGSCLDISKYDKQADAVLLNWYNGEKGGQALAEVLFGKVCPSGRLPVTFYYNDQSLPDFSDYHMYGRTYKFIQTKSAYPFGYGLSYTSFSYRSLTLAPKSDPSGALCGRITVKNTGSLTGDAVTQLYIRFEGEAFEKPIHALCYFTRTSLLPDEEQTISFSIGKRQLETILEDGSRTVLPGSYTLFAGGFQPDKRSLELIGSEGLLLPVDDCGYPLEQQPVFRCSGGPGMAGHDGLQIGKRVYVHL